MVKIWIFGFSPRVCPTEPSNLVFSLECLVSNERQALLRGIRLGGSATAVTGEGDEGNEESPETGSGSGRGGN